MESFNKVVYEEIKFSKEVPVFIKDLISKYMVRVNPGERKNWL